jgi:hypothetical protein
LPPAAGCIFAQFTELHLGVLMAIGRAYPGVKSNAGDA